MWKCRVPEKEHVHKILPMRRRSLGLKIALGRDGPLLDSALRNAQCVLHVCGFVCVCVYDVCVDEDTEADRGYGPCGCAWVCEYSGASRCCG